jgi:serine/threonine protein kinase
MTQNFTQTSSGKIFGNTYIVKKKISSGSFGVVYLGQDLKTKEYLAIKVAKLIEDEMMTLEREVI